MNKNNLYIILIGGAIAYYIIKGKKINIFPTEFATERYRVIVRKTSKVNIRDKPDLTGNIVTHFYNDQVIFAKDYDADWLVFTINNDPNGQKYYASKKYFEIYNG